MNNILCEVNINTHREILKNGGHQQRLVVGSNKVCVVNHTGSHTRICSCQELKNFLVGKGKRLNRFGNWIATREGDKITLINSSGTKYELSKKELVGKLSNHLR